jgi:hypothetical protein
MAPYGRWKRSARVSSCRRNGTHQCNSILRTFITTTYIASEVLLLAQDGLVPVQLRIELRAELSHECLVGLLAIADPEHLLERNHTDDRVELRVLDAGSLLVLGERARFGRHERGASPERGEVTADSARLVQLETIV